MIIRKEQMEALRAKMERDFVLRLSQLLRETYPELTANLSQERLVKRVEFGISRARSYGITWESTLGAFVALMFQVAPCFDEHSDIKSILGFSIVPPNERIDLLLKVLAPRQWEEAAHIRCSDVMDEEAWA